MQRLDIDQEHIESLAEREFNLAAEQDQDLPPEERRDRVALNDATTPLIAGTYIKRYDDVELWSWITGRVVGPARGGTHVAVHSPANEAEQGELILVDAAAFSDRAPADQNETPMPVIEPPPENPPDLLDLELLRMQAFAKVDARSDALIAAGFEFGGLVYSCSLEAQIRMNAMLMLAADFTYPMEINALDDRSKGFLNSPQETQAWCLTALGHIKNVVDTGTVEKDKIRNSSNVAFIANFEDSRPLPVRNPYVPETENSQATPPAEELLEEA